MKLTIISELDTNKVFAIIHTINIEISSYSFIKTILRKTVMTILVCTLIFTKKGSPPISYYHTHVDLVQLDIVMVSLSRKVFPHTFYLRRS